MKLQELELTGDMLRQLAFHEAAHAVMPWMFGIVSDLEFIDMRGNRHSRAFVQHRGLGSWYIRYLASDGDQQVAKLVAQRQIMGILAGPAAENRVGENDPDWFMTRVEYSEIFFDERNDIPRAIRCAEALYGETGRAWQFLRRMASWTDAALLHPRLWGVVEAVAERLQTAKRRISGYKVVSIMDEAWGEISGLPYRQMGRSWRRRFEPPSRTTQERGGSGGEVICGAEEEVIAAAAGEPPARAA